MRQKKIPTPAPTPATHAEPTFERRPIPPAEAKALRRARRELAKTARALERTLERIEAVQASLPLPEAHIQDLVWESETGAEHYPAVALHGGLDSVLEKLGDLLDDVEELAREPASEPASAKA